MPGLRRLCPSKSTRWDSGLAGLWSVLLVADLLVDYPEARMTYLGLLQIRADHQGRGLAAQFDRKLMELFPDARV